MNGADWIGVDWGTTHLRAFVVDAKGRVLAEPTSGDGAGMLAALAFEPALLRLIEPWLEVGRPTPVIACGMVGSKQGWREAPYRAVPCTPLADAPCPVAARDARIRPAILPGLSQPRPADVMRGEETQIAGFLAAHPDFDGVACLPGTHTKWARISAGEVVGFRTAMTGELFALLVGQSVLRHSIAASGHDSQAFADAVSDAMSQPEHLATRLFSLRAEALLEGLAPVTARSRLSGLLIGIELAAMRSFWLGQEVAVIGAEDLVGLYVGALGAQGSMPERADGSKMTLAGLVAARAAMREAPG